MSSPLRVSILTVAGLHGRVDRMEELESAITRHRPDVVALTGDFLDAVRGRHDRLNHEQLAERLITLPCANLVLVPGLQETYHWWEFQAALDRTGRSYHALDRRACIIGPLTIVGFPCSVDREPVFVEPLPKRGALRMRSKDHEAWKPWLPHCLRRYGTASRTLWLMHEPPTGTCLTQTSGVLAGNEDWRKAVRKYAPMLVVCGGDHLSPISSGHWHDSVRFTPVVNVGQPRSGPLHYSLIEMEFSSASPSLPDAMRVTCYPKGEVLIVR
jgi:Icc-related predicted phosphoesterase